MFNYEEKRKANLAGELTHNDFYSQWAEAIGLEKLENLVKTRKLIVDGPNKSPLADWDNLLFPISALNNAAYQAGKVSKKEVTLSQVVCLAKTVAKNMK